MNQLIPKFEQLTIQHKNKHNYTLSELCKQMVCEDLYFLAQQYIRKEPPNMNQYCIDIEKQKFYTSFIKKKIKDYLFYTNNGSIMFIEQLLKIKTQYFCKFDIDLQVIHVYIQYYIDYL